MAKETWIEVRILVPAGMQEEAGLFFTEFSGRGVILEEEGAPPQGVVIRAFFQSGEFGAWQQQQLQEYLERLAGHRLSPLGLETRAWWPRRIGLGLEVPFQGADVISRLVIRPPGRIMPRRPGNWWLPFILAWPSAPAAIPRPCFASGPWKKSGSR